MQNEEIKKYVPHEKKKKNQDKTSDKELTKMQISNLLDKEFKAVFIRMLIELWRRMNEQ